MSGYDLPVLNAVLNGSATLLLIAGFVAIRSGKVGLHKTLMLTALGVSAVFLVSYLTYHFAVREGQATRYVGEWRTVYLGVLLTHTVLAAAAAPLAIASATLGLLGRWRWHKRIARVTLPVWLYVSVTGVVIYWFLKDVYPKG